VNTMDTTQHIIYEQPFETKVKITQKQNAKGELQPEVEVSITRKLTDSENIIKLIDADINDISLKVKNALRALQEL